MSGPGYSGSAPLRPALPNGSRADGRTTHLCVVATGTRSDLQPLLGLAVALQDVGGFIVSFITHACHEPLVRRHALPFAPLKGDVGAVMRSYAFQEAISQEKHLAAASMLNAASTTVLDDNMQFIYSATRTADAILCGIGVLTECAAVAQKLQVPVILCPLLPFSPSGEIPLASYFAKPSSFAWLNRLTYELSGLLLWSSLGKSFNRFRTRVLQIGPQKAFQLAGIPQVCAFSEIVVPRPHDWEATVLTSAAWGLRPEVSAAGVAALQPALHRLLATHRPDAASRPIYVGFEAVPLSDPVAAIRALHALSCRTGVPVILAAGATDVEAARTSPLLEGLDGGIVWEMPGVPAGGGLGGFGGGARAAAARAAASEAAAAGGDASGSGLRSEGSGSSLASSVGGAGAASSASAALPMSMSMTMSVMHDEYGDLLFAPYVAAARGVAAAGSTAAPVLGPAGSPGEFVDAPPALAELRVLVVKEVPLEWALPRCSIAVHAGSAAATQAAFTAGVPSVPWPAVGEQFFWASRVTALQVGPLVFAPFKSLLVPGKLDEAIDAARHPTVLARAAALGEALRSRGPGSAMAVMLIRDILSRPQHRHCGITCAWVPDATHAACSVCALPFTVATRRHHCRSCGRVACGTCLAQRCHLPGYPESAPQKTCQPCLDRRLAFITSSLGRPMLPPLPPAPGAAGGSAGGGSGGGGGGAPGSARTVGVAIGPSSGSGSSGGGPHTPSRTAAGSGAAAAGSYIGGGGAPGSAYSTPGGFGSSVDSPGSALSPAGGAAASPVIPFPIGSPGSAAAGSALGAALAGAGVGAGSLTPGSPLASRTTSARAMRQPSTPGSGSGGGSVEKVDRSGFGSLVASSSLRASAMMAHAARSSSTMSQPSGGGVRSESSSSAASASLLAATMPVGSLPSAGLVSSPATGDSSASAGASSRSRPPKRSGLGDALAQAAAAASATATGPSAESATD